MFKPFKETLNQRAAYEKINSALERRRLMENTLDRDWRAGIRMEISLLLVR